MSLTEALLEIGTFLATPIIMTSLVEIDLWSIIHFIFGMIIIWALFKYRFWKRFRKNPLIFAFVIMAIYETCEVIIWYNPEIFNNLIPLPENWLNLWWDLIIGMGGAWLQLRRRKWRKK